MPEAGSWLTSLKNPNDKLWCVTKQLFEGIDFMHSLGVAHLDIKPGNILVPHHGGRLSIIDYNRAVRITNGRGSFRGVVGTEGYMAPEVAARSGLWNAICADLWSTGKTLKELCMRCDSSAPGREALLAISRRLMNTKPADRPKMSEVLLSMSQFENANLGTVQ
ncbi:hypothetical protein SCLCIDRAFT_139655 [Scleroderma citrinum Foug A]|uniref:Protein kinase domain-containing protein n=1 Tax=Scleroderma citrinum Foug A TaxID=1036808 RepID=A0A0C2YTZ7_9AGAM|nr:hypothetical protein SCLCIDRAFT_139655 [Scleroderma citrinum Foug A]